MLFRSPSLEEVKLAICGALKLERQLSAADALLESRWSRVGGDIVVEVGLSKAMLPVVLNPAAVAIATRAMEDVGEHSKLKVVSATAER